MFVDFLYELRRRGVMVGPQEAVAQEIQVRTAKHLPLQHFQTVDVALDRPGTPRQRAPGFDGLIVLRQSGGKAAQGFQRTVGGALQPGRGGPVGGTAAPGPLAGGTLGAGTLARRATAGGRPLCA